MYISPQRMNIVQLTPGAGAMYCGNCLRDNALIARFRKKGHQGLMLPLYLPLTLDEEDLSGDKPIFFGGISVYLEQKFPWMQKMPEWMHSFLRSRKLLKLAAGKAAATRPEQVGDLTLSMLRGEEGNQKRELNELVDYLKTHENPDIICLSNAMLVGMAKELREKLRVPIICMLQGEDDFLDALLEKERILAWEILRERSGHVDRFVAPTRYFAEKMSQRMGLEDHRISIIPNGLNPDGFKKSESSNKITIGYFARMCKEKGLDILVDAYIQFMETEANPDVDLHIGGSCGPSDKKLVGSLMHKLKDAGLDHRVSLFPNLSKEEKQKFFSKISIFSVPARYSEAFGLYLLEAMSSGVPCLQPSVSGFEELVAENEAGWCYGENTATNLATTLSKIMTQKQELEDKGLNGLKALDSKFHIDIVAEKYLNLFSECRALHTSD